MTPEERDALAAEYVLGTLEAREAEAVARIMAQDGELRAAIAAWEARLSPLTALSTPEAPPGQLWRRIEASLSNIPAAPQRVAGAGAGAGWLWRSWALGATGLAAGLAALLLLRPAEPPRLMTVLLSQRDQPAWVVETGGEGLRLAALNPRPLPPDRVLQLWALPQGATAPVSLGLIPPEGRITVLPGGLVPQPGMLIEITLEPPGGSPLPRPSGPVQFIGRLAAAEGS
jgi:anti-sigma-K factor RskA